MVILAFPSREYGGQEFASDKQIADFARGKNFPPNGVLMKLGSVKGAAASELWKYMRDAAGRGDPRWNFSDQYLVSKEGKVNVPTNVEAEIAALVAD